MDSVGSNRVIIAVMFIVAFLCSYSYLLWSASQAVVKQDEMIAYLMKMNQKKVMIVTAYFISNSVMCLNYKTYFEKEILITGIFSLIFITIMTFLHFAGIVIMNSQSQLILFNIVTISFFLIIYYYGKKYELFY